MRIVYAAAIAALIPLTAVAQTPPVPVPAADASEPSSGFITPLLVTAGVLGVAVVADLLTEGALSGPLLRATGLDAAPAAAGPASATALPTLPAPAVVTPPPLSRPCG